MKKMKIFISLLCAMALMLGSLPAIGLADEGDITVIVDGVTLDPAAGKAQIVGAGTTMVPFRAIFEALGFEVGYYPTNGESISTVFGYSEEKGIVIGMMIGSNNVYSCIYTDEMKNSYDTLVAKLLTGQSNTQAGAAAFIDDTGRTLVPPRAIAEALGGQVWWAAESKTVVIKTYSYCYAGTDIPAYESVMKDAGYEEGYIGAANGVYTYAFPDPISKLNDIYLGALTENGINFTDSNADDNKALYESQKNNYLLLQASIGDDKLYVTPYSNQECYIVGLSGTEVNATDIPSYTYITGSECLSWEEDEDGNHKYKYVYDGDEAGDYFETLKEYGFACYNSGAEYVCFAHDNSFIEAETDGKGYIYITPSIADIPLSPEQYEYEDGGYYFLTDIPTFKSMVGIKPADMQYNGQYNNFDFIYTCEADVVSKYIKRAFNSMGIVYEEDGSIWAESGTNKYIKIVIDEDSVRITPCVKAETYIGTNVPNYGYVTGEKCISSYSEDGKKHYFYQYDAEELSQYEETLNVNGFEKSDNGAAVWNSDGIAVEISEEIIGENRRVEIVLSNEEVSEDETDESDEADAEAGELSVGDETEE
ncbi:MAG: copper amine oxidase N-terminal domain-containing protein [Clostridia bacterium]|nr:copper amine oxidase N-terminal domain-containing protein [Clostridia bacterium]